MQIPTNTGPITLAPSDIENGMVFRDPTDNDTNTFRADPALYTDGIAGMQEVAEALAADVAAGKVHFLGCDPRLTSRAGCERFGVSSTVDAAGKASTRPAGQCDNVLVCYGSTQRSGTVNRAEVARARRALDPQPYEQPYDPVMPVSAYALAASRHMHQYGTHLKTTITTGGTPHVLYDDAYSFEHQKIVSFTPIQLSPGDTIQTDCTWNNTTTATIGYGESSDTEMCYSILFRYPDDGQEFCN